ncbi:DNA polymerase III subunit beta [Actinomadura livida]|uniref:Beta sliding clamp n=1 Tax=Actinomadura livida TaxID=79909 RepID=A0A7W7N1C7_9ACTN|nr:MULTISPECIES: DNA polymerase III subunit beta [Actinomadura]MBB4778911.1 DNA polymerase-3 subunit beta [Actinomadura catellatispora]GGU26651.1 DNA polymerase III subunit beta [Actinomadura livida]
MELRVDRQTLADAVAWAARTLPARPALPVLAGMLIEATAEGELTLAGFDYEVSARARDDATVTEPGLVLVPGRLLSDIVRNLPPQPVDIFTKGAEVVVRCGPAEFGLRTLPVEDYPTLPEPPAQAGTIPSDLFATAIGQVTPAAGRDDTLPMLTGVRIDIEGDTMWMACTDRYRIAARELTWSPADAGFTAGVVVPARTLADTAKAIRRGEDVTISLGGAGDNLIGVSGGGRSMTSRLLDDQYINYKSRLTGTWSSIAEIRVAPFTEALKRAALVTERGTPIQLAFTSGEVRIRAATGDSARANESLEVEFTGDDIDIAFAPQYLLDGLAGIDTEYARLECAGPTKAALLTAIPDKKDDDEDAPGDQADTGYRYLVMPVRLNS